MVPIIKTGDILDVSDESLKKWLKEVQKIRNQKDLFVVDKVIEKTSTTIQAHAINKQTKLEFELKSVVHIHVKIVGNIFYKNYLEF